MQQKNPLEGNMTHWQAATRYVMSMGHLKISYIMIEMNCILKDVKPTHSNIEITIILLNIYQNPINV